MGTAFDLSEMVVSELPAVKPPRKVKKTQPAQAEKKARNASKNSPKNSPKNISQEQNRSLNKAETGKGKGVKSAETMKK